MSERKTETAKRAYTCASPNCVWGHRTIQRGESYSVIMDALFSKRLHHACADKDFPEADWADEYEDMAESWLHHCDTVNFINGR
jgi:hypothetical protein